MATLSVAAVGDVTATVGITPYTGAQSGTWTAGTVNYRSYTKLKIGGTQVIHEASCLFSFSGANSSGAAVTGAETVTLSAGSTKLQPGASRVLRNGDSNTGDFGNTLRVATGRKLRSA